MTDRHKKPFELIQVRSNPQRSHPDFAHPSEAQCAKILDFYQIQWEYEPKTFAIRWNKHGDVIESFTPDFYLPQLDQYIELTTLSQKLVTKKNRKVRLLKELHPEVKIKILYQKDLKNLLFKYNFSMEGSSGEPHVE